MVLRTCFKFTEGLSWGLRFCSLAILHREYDNFSQGSQLSRRILLSRVLFWGPPFWEVLPASSSLWLFFAQNSGRVQQVLSVPVATKDLALRRAYRASGRRPSSHAGLLQGMRSLYI